MFPTIFALGVKGLGPNTKIGGSIIVMSVVGAGLAPPLLGYIAKTSGSYALGYTVALTAYIVVAFYGFTRIYVLPSIELQSHAALGNEEY